MKARSIWGSGRILLFAASMLGVTGTAGAQVQGVSDTEITIGSISDLSGPIASTGGPQRDGMVFAVEEINAAGGIHGRKLRLLVEDHAYDQKRAVLAAQKLLTQDKVFALVNVLGSPTALAAMPLAINRGVPFLFTAAASDATWVPHHPLKFGLMTPNSESVRAMVRYAHDKLGKRRFGVLYQDDDNGQSFVRAAETQFKQHGLASAGTVSFKRGEVDFAAQVARLKAADVDVVLLGTAGARDTAAAAIETRKQGWKVDLVTGIGASTNVTIKLGGEAVEGMHTPFQFLNSAQEMTPAFKAVVDRFKARFGQEPGDGVAMGYTAVMLFAQGARNAGATLTPQTLTQGLEKVQNFTTPFEGPPFSFSPTDHGAPRSTIVMQVRGGKFVRVAGPLSY